MPAVWDGISAKLTQAAGFKTAFLSGSCCAASRLGGADLDLISFGEMFDSFTMVRRAAPDLLILADGDHGYGNAMNVQRTVRAYGQAGAAAVVRDFGGQLPRTAAALRQALATPLGDNSNGPLADIRRQRVVLAAAGDAAIEAALLLEAAATIAPGGAAPGALAAQIARAAERCGLPPARLAPAIRAAALAVNTDDGAARIAASSLAEAIAAALTA
jgi:hypothetical protein